MSKRFKESNLEGHSGLHFNTAATAEPDVPPALKESNKLSATSMGENSIPSFKAADLVVRPSSRPKAKQPTFSFGTAFTDHMLSIEWTLSEGWQTPLIRPLGSLSLHPACSALHYGIQLFEGLKAYRGDDNRVRIFRPMLNMSRMARSARRACLPAFDQSELLECIRRLVELDQDWVPHTASHSLYIRPTFISTESSLGIKKPTCALLYVIMCQAGSYFNDEAEPVSLWADPKYTRAWKGGTGDCKMGGNYGGALLAQHEAMDYGCQQVLWLHGGDHQITEAGSMNIFLHWINEDGEEELATPPLDGIILPGITRQSILELTSKWGGFKATERYLTMGQLCTALKQQRVKEMFGSGTACMICPIGRVFYQGETLRIPSSRQEISSRLTSRIAKALTDIQLGRARSDWTFLV
ncbi:branched-chain-amino-acid aminotransferase, cytosolic isoform X2 [Betta splendens]|uniref:Branched-chain-amino-acid aminotransferase n=1 Tax=Betta splendens TaxID=158456 RepID=A0A6P7NPJ7_BETSP|nr:branched-chain-amino-acid aminotransferase, cytosolic isoform X2 [Betta splendens]